MPDPIRGPVAAIEAWLAEHAPALLPLLGPPADAGAIAAFESRTGLALPPDARALYATHDGEADGSDGLFGCRRWLPLREVEASIREIESDGILPLFRSGGGDFYYVRAHDAAAPDPRLYEWWHEVPEEAEVVAESLPAFLASFVAALHAGGYVYLPDELAALIDRDDL